MMTPNEIKAKLVRRGITQKHIGTLVKPRPVHLKTVNVVINGHQRSRPIQEAIAKALDIPYEDIWGNT